MVKHAIILAAGLGTRMRPLTNTCPKPLIIIKDKPLIQYCIDLLFFVGIEKICINTHYMSNMLIEYLTSLNEKRIVISEFMHQVLLLYFPLILEPLESL